MKTTSKKAAKRSTMSDELRIFNQGLGAQYKPATRILEKLMIECPHWMPVNLLYQMWDSLSGYSLDMQEQMVGNLGDFLWSLGRKLTGVKHVDEQLMKLYREIHAYAKQHGEKLNECPF